MNSEPPPLKQPGWFQRHGCLVVLVFIVTGLVALVLLTAYMVTGTAVPFRTVAQMIEDAFPGVKIKGVSGSIKTGPTVESITWGEDPANRSEIAGLRIKYNGYREIRDKKQLVLTDVGVTKARIDLADFEEFMKEVHAESEKTASSKSSRRSSKSSSSSSSSSPLTEFGLQSFEIKQMLIEDVLITNRKTGLRLSIPKVLWTGFKATPSTIESGDLLVESDRLTMRTTPGQKIPLEGNAATPKRTLAGTVQPLMHPAVLKSISFMVEYAFLPEQKEPWYQLRTADDKVQVEATAGGGHALHVSHLDLGAFLDAAKLYGKDAADFPSDLVLEATQSSEDHVTQIVSGSFRLGATTFQIQPGKLPTGEEEGEPELVATARTGAGEIRWTLPLADWPGQYRPVVTSSPEIPLREILAQIFTGKKYADLTVEEKQSVDARLPAYTPKLPE